MKKYLVLLLLFPIILNAECNQDLHKEYTAHASNITYNNQYDYSRGSWSLTIYNITKEFYAVYNNKTLKSDDDNKIVITGINQGATIGVSIYGNDGCEPIKYYGITEGYYNEFYNSNDCKGYEDMEECSKEFTSSKITRSILNTAKEYYKKSFPNDPTKKNKDENLTLIDVIKEYISKWWIKVALAVITTIVSISVFSSKLRKVKHGI